MTLRLPRRAWLLGLALLITALPSLAATAPQPFDARYHLEVSGWPDVDIEHQLSQEAGHWHSEMRASLPGASGHEWGRFRLDDERVRSLHYAAGYSLLGIRRSYSLRDADLAPLPDRQSALVALARRVIDETDGGEGRLRYRDHRGREERLDYRVLDRDPVTLPAGRFAAVRVALAEPDEDDRRMEITFDADRPGLLLGMAYYRDGERKSRLSLTRLDGD
ncbi:hypothetical protein [Halomonas salina]|uniref:DUF3108 domain-containing protein n=1 Tax=Halomonas salina TaxID=42565 RepID=A0ABR4WUP7_9GAMM|nr:hypothetical protein [Halomonas salina]KGE78446.1 hypothetical protein FP66_03125 [Halomonas salina]